MARSTSSAPTSRSLTATMPVELKLRMWLPAMPTKAELILQSAISSASSRARWIAATVASIFTTTPFFRPLDSCEPMPSTSSPPSGASSATRHATFEVPMSRATTRFLFSLAIKDSRPTSHAQREAIRVAQVHDLARFLCRIGAAHIRVDEAREAFLGELAIASQRELQAVGKSQPPAAAPPPPAPSAPPSHRL